EARRQVRPRPTGLLREARRQVLVGPGADLLAEAGQGPQAATRGDDGGVLGQGLQRLRGALPGADAEAGLVSHLQEAGHLVEEPRELEILHICNLPPDFPASGAPCTVFALPAVSWVGTRLASFPCQDASIVTRPRPVGGADPREQRSGAPSGQRGASQAHACRAPALLLPLLRRD